MPINLKNWLRGHRGKQPQEDVYVDSTTVPEEPAGPYRARFELSTHEPAVEGIEVSERETVAGELQVLYAIRCPCGHRWESTQFQRMSICPKCGRAVLVNVPTLPSE